LCLSPEVLAEVTDVLTRPKTQSRFPQLTPERVERFLREVQAKANAFASVPAVFSYPRDPDDEPYLNLALAAGARYLVTWDNDLLDLMDEQTPEGKEFRRCFPDLIILDPVAFLRQLSRAQLPQPPSPPG
jgi:putative PIN family toxin of toxin-antitoxin system